MTSTSLLIMVGTVISFAVSANLYKKRTGTVTAVLALYVFGFIFAVIIARFLHWYSSSTTYESILQPFTDFTIGTFCPSGIILGACIAGALVGLLPICENKNLMMDCAAPGTALLMVFVRLSAWGTGKCQGGKNITTELLQRLPFAVKGEDAAGNVYYRFATFIISAALFLIAFFIILGFYNNHIKTRMKKPAKRYGNAWNMLLTLYAAIEIVLDSTRIDSMHFTFRKILTLNRFSTFISIGQIVPFIILICVFVHYVRCSSKANGFSVREIISIVLFAGSAFMIGYLGEYKWQREGMYISYVFMAAGAFIITVVIRVLYGACIKRRRTE